MPWFYTSFISDPFTLPFSQHLISCQTYQFYLCSTSHLQLLLSSPTASSNLIPATFSLPWTIEHGLTWHPIQPLASLFLHVASPGSQIWLTVLLKTSVASRRMQNKFQTPEPSTKSESLKSASRKHHCCLLLTPDSPSRLCCAAAPATLNVPSLHLQVSKSYTT